LNRSPAPHATAGARWRAHRPYGPKAEDLDNPRRTAFQQQNKKEKTGDRTAAGVIQPAFGYKLATVASSMSAVSPE
jgi:hypothetical protein